MANSTTSALRHDKTGHRFLVMLLGLAIWLSLQISALAQSTTTDIRVKNLGATIVTDNKIVMFNTSPEQFCTWARDIWARANGDSAAQRRQAADVQLSMKHVLYAGTKVYVLQTATVRCDGLPDEFAVKKFAEVRVTDASSQFNGQIAWVQTFSLGNYQAVSPPHNIPNSRASSSPAVSRGGQPAELMRSWLASQMVSKCFPGFTSGQFFLPPDGQGAINRKGPSFVNNVADEDSNQFAEMLYNSEPRAIKNAFIDRHIGQLANLAPADRGLYADATSTLVLEHTDEEWFEITAFADAHDVPNVVPRASSVSYSLQGSGSDGLGSSRKEVEELFGFYVENNRHPKVTKACGLVGERFTTGDTVKHPPPSTFTFVYRNDQVIAIDVQAGD